MTRMNKGLKIGIVSVVAGFLVGLVHGFAHLAFGDPASFQAAAVTPVGVAVSAATVVFVAVLLSVKALR